MVANLLAMLLRNIICAALLAAFISGLSWALHALSKSMDFWSFMILGVVTIALMVTAGFAYDRYERRNLPPAP
jgi:hypothetical protein